MSIESAVRRSLWRMIFFRFIGDLASIPRHLCLMISTVFQLAGAFFGQFEKTIFALEVDAARRYRAITDVDLALAIGESSRYSGTRTGLAAKRDATYDATAEDHAQGEDAL